MSNLSKNWPIVALLNACILSRLVASGVLMESAGCLFKNAENQPKPASLFASQDAECQLYHVGTQHTSQSPRKKSVGVNDLGGQARVLPLPINLSGKIASKMLRTSNGVESLVAEKPNLRGVVNNKSSATWKEFAKDKLEIALPNNLLKWTKLVLGRWFLQKMTEKENFIHNVIFSYEVYINAEVNRTCVIGQQKPSTDSLPASNKEFRETSIRPGFRQKTFQATTVIWKSVEEKLRRKRKWFGHLVQMGEEKTKASNEGAMTEGRRGKEKPRTMYMDNIEMMVKKRGKGIGN
ncbi:hypothetical protein ANN_00651 [Periplaneta americana]|uniref:Uncharacterized protein n=1 Tax=Periplaneta americana TaxID=6978 RepID=A0ABQ8TUL8_PERAM|nr:hypothetical protein ANN_00651 [Periplaneta americana]